MSYPPIELALLQTSDIKTKHGETVKATALGIFEHRSGVQLCIPLFEKKHHDLNPLVFDEDGKTIVLGVRSVGPAIKPCIDTAERLSLYNECTWPDKMTGQFIGYHCFDRNVTFAL